MDVGLGTMVAVANKVVGKSEKSSVVAAERENKLKLHSTCLHGEIIYSYSVIHTSTVKFMRSSSIPTFYTDLA